MDKTIIKNGISILLSLFMLASAFSVFAVSAKITATYADNYNAGTLQNPSVTISDIFDGCSPLDMGENFKAFIRHTSSGKYITDSNDNLVIEDGKFDDTQTFHFIRNDDGSYSIINDAKNKCFDVQGGVYENGTNIHLWESSKIDSQKFYIYFTKGNFYFRCFASTKVFDVDGGTENLGLWGDDTGSTDAAVAARAFEILKINLDYGDVALNLGADDTVYIRNVASGLLMSANGNDVFFGEAKYTDNQKWKLLRRADGSYEIVSLSNSLFLDVTEGDIDNGTLVNLWQCNGKRMQGFYFLPTDEDDYCVIKPCYSKNVLDMSSATKDLKISTPRLDEEASKAAQLFEIVFERICENTIPAINLGNEFEAYITDEEHGHTLTDINGTSLEAIPTTKDVNQLFKFIYDESTNSYEIIGNSGKAVDVTGINHRDGSVVGMFIRNNSASQRFRLYKVGEFYCISPIYTNRLLDISMTDHKTVSLWGSMPQASRKFTLRIKSDENKLILKNASSYVKEDKLLYKVSAGQTVGGVLSNFENTSAEVWNKDGNSLSESEMVATGYTVNLVIDGVKIDSVTIVIKGDVSCDGVIDVTDYMRVKAAFAESYSFNSVTQKAADVDGNGTIDITDYLRIKNHFLEIYNLFS